MRRQPSDVLPLKPLVFQALLVLADADRHGWSLVQEIQRRNGDNRLLPGNLYRLLNAMEAEGLIEIVEPSKRELARAAAESGANADRRRYFGLTAFGREVARAEAHRLEALVDESRRKRLITARPR